jgi:hypothetical protein
MLRSVLIMTLLAVCISLAAQTADTVAKPRILRQWTLSKDFSEELRLPLDTAFPLFHRYRITDRYSPVNATLGNYGLPFYPISFFDRVTDPDKFLYAFYYPFMWVPDKAIFMNTQVPFTELSWSFAGTRQTAEQTFRILHTQNVNRFLNFGLIYDIVFNLGEYSYQRADNKNFTFFTSWTGDRYKLYFSAGINNIMSQENGGVTDMAQLSEQSNTRDVPVNLGGANNARSTLRNRSVLLVQRYTIGGTPKTPADSGKVMKTGFFGLSGTFSHIFAIEGNKRMYQDDLPGGGFYDSVYIDNPLLPTFDSLTSRYIKNTVRFDFTTDEARKFRLGGGAGIRNELLRYSQIIPTFDTLYSASFARRRGNNALVGRLYNNIGDNFGWIANGELFITGYRAGDFSLDGIIRKNFDWKRGPASWNISGGISATQPSIWLSRWGSNHFIWNENMKKEFRINASTTFSYPGRHAYAKFNYAIIDNYTDFNTSAYPSQHEGGLSVAAVSAGKNLRAWKFHLNTDAIIQQSSNTEVLDLPLVTLRSAAFFEHNFIFESTNGNLETQLGAEAVWHTEYYPYTYMPATGRFYRQDQVKAGNYPFVNVFLNFKLRRTRFFIMYDHVNSGLTGNDYFMVPQYPLNFRMLRYGLSWTFYD